MLNRQYFEDCFIQGDVAFIFGNAPAAWICCCASRATA
ncbi:MAG: hypothetical protein IKK21_08025 [Clostridia bacterium]|nr:hypothetical protein [Clostridia bacterium]